jgi:hypothetical protein
MATRTTDSLVHFDHPFSIEGIARTLPAGEYRVVNEEESIEGLSFMAYRRVSTSIVLPVHFEEPTSSKRADRFASVELIRIAPADLARALQRDADQLPVATAS